MQELGINSTAYETQSKKGTKRKCRSKEHDNGTGNDEIERDLSDDDDVEYDPEMEEDKGEMEDKAEKQTDNAAPIQEEDEMMSAPQTQGGLQVRTTTSEIERRAKAYESSKQKKFYHHMGPKTYEEKRKEWMQEKKIYPSMTSSSGATFGSTLTTKNIDRVVDWYCSLHTRDASGRRTIYDPGTKKIAEAVFGWRNKEVTGEFVPQTNKDALYMVLGKDHDGRVKGKGGVRLGLGKVYGAEYSATRSSSVSNASQDMESKMKSAIEELEKRMKNQFSAILEHMGLLSLDELELNVTPGDKLSQQDPETPREVFGSIPKPLLLDPSA
ncbi:hypothetical protein BVRB_002810 [Beta vulgaris subsp. vulgaris]|uniref:Uncharacterized protein n=1 Tax=Beta vulgaris subsp. vulgaris TaxID=3555 RepID=A0A0J8B8B2_BETVV|nr:hypothetical protein BVRB_002810 [Beta vulgaris subsp. vulgaris]